MLKKKLVDMYARGSGVDLLVAERDVVLTYILKILSDSGIANNPASHLYDVNP